MGRRARLAASILVLVVAATAVGQGPERMEERFTTCWPCHVTWPTPLQTFYHIVPPAEQGGPVGEPFDYTIEVRNTWLHDLVFLEPALDLSNASSLKFHDGREPVDITRDGVIPSDPTQPTTPQQGFVTFEVPTGATDLNLTLTPAEPIGEYDLTMVLYPGRSQPEGDPAVPPIDEAGPGEPETFGASGVELAQLGFGNWTVAARYTPVSTGGVQPPLGDIDFRVSAHAAFNANDQPVQYLSRTVLVKPGQTTLVTWTLQPVALPAPDERVDLIVNATVFWEHLPSSNADDFANITKQTPLNVTASGNDVFITADPDAIPAATTVRPPGLTVTTVSEAVGYMAGFLLLASIYSGGVFGRASRRQMNRLFGTARRRVAFHNFLSYGLTAAAVVHMVLFVIDAIEPQYRWTVGLIWGGIAILAMFGLGLTGAFQVPMIRRWNYAMWRWSHLALAIAALLFTLVHMFLDGAHFGEIQDLVGWRDPLDPRDVFEQG